MVYTVGCFTSKEALDKAVHDSVDFDCGFVEVSPMYTNAEFAEKIRQEKQAARAERLERREKERQERYPQSKAKYEKRKDAYEMCFEEL